MIEVAAVLSALVQHWADFAIIMALLIFNAGVGFWQEYTAGNAVEALKKQLALKARALRDGKWQEIALIWGYSITSAFVTDVVKVEVYRHLANQTPRHRTFLKQLTRTLVHHHQVRH